MPEATELLRPEKILEIILRRRWLLIIPFCFSMVVGIYFAITLEKRYEAGTMILVQPQRVPTSYVRSLVSSGIDSRISTISQQIMSRTNLESIISEFRIFSEPGYVKLFMEEKIENMRKRIVVKVSRVRSGAEAFSIKYRDRKPQRAMRVTNSLATYFIDENLRVREAQAIGTSDFLDDELNTTRKRLVSLEIKLKDYRKGRMGTLPEQTETNLRMLDRLQEHLIEKGKDLRELKIAADEMERQLSEAGFTKKIESKSDWVGMTEIKDENSLKIEQMKKQLEGLSANYTTKHPDVVRLKKKIRNLEDKLNKENETQPFSDKTAAESISGQTESSDFGPANLQKTQYKALLKEINSLKFEASKLKKDVVVYRKRLEETPKTEQGLLEIKRDYGNMQASYNSLLQRRMEAEIAVNMEKKQKGEQFRILDPARVPEKPIEPDLKKIFMLFIVAGLGLGAGLTFVLEYLDTSFKDPKEIQTVIGLPTLAMVAKIYQPEEKRLMRLNYLCSILSTIFSLALLGVFFVVTLKSPDTGADLLRKLYAVKEAIF